MWKVIDIEILALPHESLFLVFQENRTMIFNSWIARMRKSEL